MHATSDTRDEQGRSRPNAVSDPDADLALARAALAGAKEARRAFIVRMRCVPKMLAARNARLGRPLQDAELEDLSQETLLSIWRQLGSFAGRSTLETWAYRFCQHALLNHLRVRSRRPRSSEASSPSADDPGLRRLQEYAHVHDAVDRLPNPDGRVVRMKHFERRTFQEIARVLRFSPSTAKTYYYRGIARMKELLDTEEGREAS